MPTATRPRLVPWARGVLRAIRTRVGVAARVAGPGASVPAIPVPVSGVLAHDAATDVLAPAATRTPVSAATHFAAWKEAPRSVPVSELLHHLDQLQAEHGMKVSARPRPGVVPTEGGLSHVERKAALYAFLDPLVDRMWRQVRPEVQKKKEALLHDPERLRVSQLGFRTETWVDSKLDDFIEALTPGEKEEYEALLEHTELRTLAQQAGTRVDNHLKGGFGTAMGQNFAFLSKLGPLLQACTPEQLAHLPEGWRTHPERLFDAPFLKQGFLLSQYLATTHLGLMTGVQSALQLDVSHQEENAWRGLRLEVEKGQLVLCLTEDGAYALSDLPEQLDRLQDAARMGCPALRAKDPDSANLVGAMREYVTALGRKHVAPALAEALVARLDG